jgi:hypothetical protein
MNIFYRSVWNENYIFVLMVSTLVRCGVKEREISNLEKQLPVRKKRDTNSSYKVLPTQIRKEYNIFV